jgi:hypothetical protein
MQWVELEVDSWVFRFRHEGIICRRKDGQMVVEAKANDPTVDWIEVATDEVIVDEH